MKNILKIALLATLFSNSNIKIKLTHFPNPYNSHEEKTFTTEFPLQSLFSNEELKIISDQKINLTSLSIDINKEINERNSYNIVMCIHYSLRSTTPASATYAEELLENELYCFTGANKNFVTANQNFPKENTKDLHLFIRNIAYAYIHKDLSNQIREYIYKDNNKVQPSPLHSFIKTIFNKFF